MLSDLCRIDVHVNDLAADPTRPPAGRERSKAHPNRQDDIGLLQCFPPELVHHPPIAQREWVVLGDDALARARHDDRNR